jgi:amidase
LPALADIAPADADVNPASAAIAWRNGTWVANGNLILRHLGIPTVTVPMGMLSDIGMPIGLTFAAKPYEDAKLLRYAYAFEQSGSRRQTPPRTPPLPGDVFPEGGAVAPADRQGASRSLTLKATLVHRAGDSAEIQVEGETDAPHVRLFINGAPLDFSRDGKKFSTCRRALVKEHRSRHSEWREPYGHVILAVASGEATLPVACYVIIDGVA